MKNCKISTTKIFDEIVPSNQDTQKIEYFRNSLRTYLQNCKVSKTYQKEEQGTTFEELEDLCDDSLKKTSLDTNI